MFLMRKAVSDIVLVVLFLVIGVTLLGLAYALINNLQDQNTSDAGKSSEHAIRELGSCIKTVSFDSNSGFLQIKNCGKYNLENITVFVDNNPVISERMNVKPNEFKDIAVNPGDGVHDIRLESDYASAFMRVKVGSAGEMPSGFMYRMPVFVSGSASDISDYQALAIADTASLISSGKMRADCADIMFADSDGKTSISFWLESDCDSGFTRLWVRVPNIPKVSGTTVYMYYGNLGAASASDFDGTFTKEYNATGANDDDLLAEWHFDESGGSSITIDSSGNGNTGILTNMNVTGNATSGWIYSDGGQWDGRADVRFSSGSALNFDGINDYINVGNPPILDIDNGDLTVELWVKRGFMVGGTGYGGVFKGNGDLSKNAGWLLRLGSANPGDLKFSGGDGSSNVFRTGGANVIPEGAWTHVAGVLNRSGKIAIAYVNGTVVGTDLLSKYENSISSADDLLIGRDMSYEHMFNGTLDEIRIYKRPLSAEEIYRHYIRSRYASPAPLATVGAEEAVHA